MPRFLIAAMLAGVALVPVAASAQSDLPARVGKLEGEMRAVQRKVFPGGAGQYLEPEVTAAPAPVGPPPGTPATSAVADLTSRVASLEEQVATLTGQVEQSDHRVRQLQEQFDSYRRETDAKFAAAAPAPPPPADADDQPAPAPSRNGRSGSGPSRTPAADAAPVGDDAGSADAASSGDPAEDAYLNGYHLWQAKKYPEAEAQLKKVVATYPKSKRASYAQNLLGRSYLDDGKPSLASMAFYDNYKKMPEGERAPDSLYYLGQALMKLNKPADACKVYGELTDVYGARIGAEMKANVARGRAAAKCE